MRPRDLLPHPRQNISGPDAARHIAAGAVLLDVRTQAEWDREHAAEAVHIPLGELPDRIGELDPGRAIVTLCTAGFRSAIAANQLRDAGFTASSLRTGMPGWRSTGRPMVGGR